MNVEAPIACTLSAGDFRKRLERIGRLNRKHLKRHEQDGLTLRLVYQPPARGEIRKLVELERTCCAFLNFEIEERQGELVLKIDAPERARVAAESMFADFTSGASPARASACGCC